MNMSAHLFMTALTWALNARPWLQAVGRALLALGHCLLSLAAATHLLHCCLQKLWIPAAPKALFWLPCEIDRRCTKTIRSEHRHLTGFYSMAFL